MNQNAAHLSPVRNEDAYGWVVVAAAFTLMFIGFAAAYCFAAFFTAFLARGRAADGGRVRGGALVT